MLFVPRPVADPSPVRIGRVHGIVGPPHAAAGRADPQAARPASAAARRDRRARTRARRCSRCRRSPGSESSCRARGSSTSIRWPSVRDRRRRGTPSTAAAPRPSRADRRPAPGTPARTRAGRNTRAARTSQASRALAAMSCANSVPTASDRAIRTRTGRIRLNLGTAEPRNLENPHEPQEPLPHPDRKHRHRPAVHALDREADRIVLLTRRDDVQQRQVVIRRRNRQAARRVRGGRTRRAAPARRRRACRARSCSKRSAQSNGSTLCRPHANAWRLCTRLPLPTISTPSSRSGASRLPIS